MRGDVTYSTSIPEKKNLITASGATLILARNKKSLQSYRVKLQTLSNFKRPKEKVTHDKSTKKMLKVEPSRNNCGQGKSSWLLHKCARIENHAFLLCKSASFFEELRKIYRTQTTEQILR